jgi:hypothetical protein
MIKSAIGRAAVAAGLVTLGTAGVVAAQSPAQASTFTGTYSCTSVLGTSTISGSASLTATPNPATAGSPTHWVLSVSGISSPVTISSWSGSANVSISGAETAGFSLAGSGGTIPANTPSTVTMAGNWTPSATGSDDATIPSFSVTGRVLFTSITVNCTAVSPIPVAETLTVT